MQLKDKISKKRILFIINPVSGNNKRKNKQQIIEQTIDKSKFEIEYKYTEYRKHATEIAEQAVKDKVDIVIAVGGDGTINEVSKAIINSPCSFGIIPSGSGNGLGRFLKIPLKTEKAVKIINKEKLFTMDSIQINHEYFVNMAGVGFDARIGHLFANLEKRGFRAYLRLILKEFFKYQPSTYTLRINDQPTDIEAFLISFANSSQFGYNAHIAPLAKINDGLIDVCILKKFSKWHALLITILLYSKHLLKSKYYTIKKASKIEILNNKKLEAHIDGDPVTFDSNVTIEIIPESLNILIP